MEKTVTVAFTAPEFNALLQLIHRAVLRDGMDVAEAAVAITNKLKQALQAAEVAEKKAAEVAEKKAAEVAEKKAAEAVATKDVMS